MSDDMTTKSNPHLEIVGGRKFVPPKEELVVHRMIGDCRIIDASLLFVRIKAELELDRSMKALMNMLNELAELNRAYDYARDIRRFERSTQERAIKEE